MAEKERYQNINCEDVLTLRMFTYNSNNVRNIQSISKVEIYSIDNTLKSSDNPDGLSLVETIENITQNGIGEYSVQTTLINSLYEIGSYKDVWYVVFEDNECTKVQNSFQINTSLWFTTTMPPVYDFNFNFNPNKFRKGSKQNLLIKVEPNVPRGSELDEYYKNFSIISDLKISMEIEIGDCLPYEQDLRLIIDKEPVLYKGCGIANYFMDTSEYAEGIYNIWFDLTFGENLFVSDKNALQIF